MKKNAPARNAAVALEGLEPNPPHKGPGGPWGPLGGHFRPKWGPMGPPWPPMGGPPWGPWGPPIPPYLPPVALALWGSTSGAVYTGLELPRMIMISGRLLRRIEPLQFDRVVD